MGKKESYEDEEMTVELELEDGTVVNCEEPILAYIEDDDVYEKVADAFDEYLDSCEFDEIIDDNDSEE